MRIFPNIALWYISHNGSHTANSVEFFCSRSNTMLQYKTVHVFYDVMMNRKCWKYCVCTLPATSRPTYLQKPWEHGDSSSIGNGRSVHEELSASYYSQKKSHFCHQLLSSAVPPAFVKAAVGSKQQKSRKRMLIAQLMEDRNLWRTVIRNAGVLYAPPLVRVIGS